MTKKVLILAANPKKESFTNHLAIVYANSSMRKYEIRLLKLHEMNFDPNLADGYDNIQVLEEPLQVFQDSLKWCDHLVIFTPIWWGALPAKFKGLIDRVLLPGFAFQYENNKSIHKKLLTKKTARIIMTMDTPPWYYRMFQGAPAVKQLKIATLKFIGFNSVKITMFGPVISSNDTARSKWMNFILKLGEFAK